MKITRKEAIDTLKKRISPYINCAADAEANEVIKMAIKALKQGDALDKIKADIKEWYWQVDKQALSKDPCVVDAMIDLFMRIIDKHRAEQEVIE